MKSLLALLLLIPSLSWGNHEVLICEDYYEYSFSEDHTILFINYLDGTTKAFNIVDSNEVWIYYQHFEDESWDKSFNRYSKEIDGYECRVFETN